MKEEVAVHWFRRDLRWHDNHALDKAFQSGYPVLPVFIFDRNILDDLPKNDARVHFIYNALQEMMDKIEGKAFVVKHDTPENAWSQLIKEYNIKAVFYNKDYEPYAKERDEKIHKLLDTSGIEIKTFKDHVIFEENEVLTAAGKPYTVFTPFKNNWLKGFEAQPIEVFSSEKKLNLLADGKADRKHTPEFLGFQQTDIDFPKKTIRSKILTEYAEKRDYPASEGTSRLGVHLRFGTISIRELSAIAKEKSATFLNELIWRDFYQSIIFHFPHVVNHSFKPDYDAIPWEKDEDLFQKWCAGKTGFPLVDAGMRELNESGYMHNRIRMLTASFLTKHLLQDWRKGEAYFAEKLLDFELASNNGGWQWAAGSGCDAAPYFRIFNPEIQLKKFDKNLEYVKKWVPEYDTANYPRPVIGHKAARERALKVYKEALSKK
ncbi:MAG: deoxyribodipyrimidine photo-lyase [Chitinophagaceae bacterium]|nr:MAG: deoxyribodipyrimidine photo-lyase [Chitinophagaceae bacterium]